MFKVLSTSFAIFCGISSFFFMTLRVLLFALLTRLKFLKPLRILLNLENEFHPLGHTQITKEFILKKITTSEGEDKKKYAVTVHKIESLGNCSAMQKVQLVDKSQDNKPVHTLISKTATSHLIFRFILTRKPELQMNEGYFYSKLFKLENQGENADPEFEKKLEVVRKYAPHVHHFAETSFFCNFLLLMDDLTQHRFSCMVELKGATMHQCKTIISSVTKIHAALCNEVSKIREHFPFFVQGVPLSFYDPKPYIKFNLHYEWRKKGLPAAIKEEGPEAETKYQELEELIKFVTEHKTTKVKKLIEILTNKDTPQTLIHGDFRLDNAAYRDHDDAVKLMDWQMSCICTPAVDAVYFALWASKSAEVAKIPLENFHEQVLQHHYQELMSHENVASQFPDFTWNKYMHLVKTCVPLLMPMFVLMHSATPTLQKQAPINRKSLNAMVKNWKIKEHIEQLFA